MAGVAAKLVWCFFVVVKLQKRENFTFIFENKETWHMAHKKALKSTKSLYWPPYYTQPTLHSPLEFNTCAGWFSMSTVTITVQCYTRGWTLLVPEVSVFLPGSHTFAMRDVSCFKHEVVLFQIGTGSVSNKLRAFWLQDYSCFKQEVLPFGNGSTTISNRYKNRDKNGTECPN